MKHSNQGYDFILLKSPCVCVLHENRKYARYRDASYMGWVLKPGTPESGSWLFISYFFINCAPLLSLFAGVSKTLWNGQPGWKDFCHVRLKSAGNIMDCMQQSWCPWSAWPEGRNTGRESEKSDSQGSAAACTCASHHRALGLVSSFNIQTINFLLAPNISTFVVFQLKY